MLPQAGTHKCTFTVLIVIHKYFTNIATKGRYVNRLAGDTASSL